MRNREEAAKAALASVTNTPYTCQLWTRGIFGAPSAGDRDFDGDADAVDGWKSEPTAHKHPGDRKPPRGTPVSYSGGSKGYGHRAISLGPVNGVYMVRSTDAPRIGYVGTVPLDWFERNWGLHYLGWSNTITGQLIPMPPPPEPKGPPTRGERVDDAIDKLRGARRKSDEKKRDNLLTKAIDALKKITPTR